MAVDSWRAWRDGPGLVKWHVGRRVGTCGGVVLWVVEERDLVGLRGDDVQVRLKAMRVGVDEGHRPWHEGIAAGGKEN